MNNPGCVVSHTKKFLALREEQKAVISDILAQRLEAIEKKYKLQSNSYDVNTFLSSLIGQGHCATCGDSFTFYNNEVHCCVCKGSFCTKHVRAIKSETIISAMDLESDKNLACEKCGLMLEYQATNEQKRKIRDALKSSQLLVMYNDVNGSKQMLHALMTQFEYLADSITSVKSAGKSTEKEDASWGASYNASKTAEKKIVAQVKDFQSHMQQLQSYQAEGSEKIVFKNVTLVFVEFLKNFLPGFKDVQKKIARVELNHVSKVYLLVKQLEFETKSHAVFRGSWGKLLQKAIEEIQKEVTQITLLATGETDWAIAKESLEKRVKRRERSLLENPTKSLLAPQKTPNSPNGNNTNGNGIVPVEVAIANMVEPLLMKKVMLVVRQLADRFSQRRIQTPTTHRVLGWLISELEKEFDFVTTSLK